MTCLSKTLLQISLRSRRIAWADSYSPCSNIWQNLPLSSRTISGFTSSTTTGPHKQLILYQRHQLNELLLAALILMHRWFVQKVYWTSLPTCVKTSTQKMKLCTVQQKERPSGLVWKNEKKNEKKRKKRHRRSNTLEPIPLDITDVLVRT